MTSVARSGIESRPITGRGLVLCAAASGAHGAAVDELRARFPDHDLEVCPPSDLRRRVQQASAEGRRFVGVAGDDDIVRIAAEELTHSDTPLLAIPGGTRHHFATALGIATLDDAAKAADPDGGATRVVDLARVNGRSFVNTSSVGFYPGVVPRRTWHRRTVPTPLATLLAAVHQLWTGRRLIVQIDRRPVVAWLVFVGNGCYGERVTDLASRESLDDSLLDVRVVRADQRLARLRLAAALVFGRLARGAVVDRRTCREITIGVRDWRRIDVALDGEELPLATPLRYESDARALRVLVPR